MPVNRNALLRYRTIDRCLQNRQRRWTLHDLVEACSEALYEYEGIDKGVSKRTVQLDLQMMRSDKLGYEAPIVVEDMRYYTYADPNYSITNSPVSEQDLSKLREVVQTLQQFGAFSQWEEVQATVKRLENKLDAVGGHTSPAIYFETNDRVVGLQHLDALYKAVLNRQRMQITYQSFKAPEPGIIHLSPFWLREWRNRWYVVGKDRPKGQMLHMALDRIQALEPSPHAYAPPAEGLSPEVYYQHVVGITVNNKRPQLVRLYFRNLRAAEYLRTKPWHASQRENPHQEGVLVTMYVIPNFELEKEILGLGEQVEVLAPKSLRASISRRLRQAGGYYPEGEE